MVDGWTGKNSQYLEEIQGEETRYSLKVVRYCTASTDGQDPNPKFQRQVQPAYELPVTNYE
jgi:hypothetical protein